MGSVGTGPSHAPAQVEAALDRRNNAHSVLHPSKILIGAQETRARNTQKESTSFIGRQFMQGSGTMKNGRTARPTRVAVRKTTSHRFLVVSFEDPPPAPISRNRLFFR